MNENVDELLENCAMCEKKKSLKTLQYMLRILCYTCWSKVTSLFERRLTTRKATMTPAYSGGMYPWKSSINHARNGCHRKQAAPELDSLLTCTPCMCRNTCMAEHTMWKVEGRWHKYRTHKQLHEYTHIVF